ncbi:uncharacterized protein DUF4184 [Kribbella sp. VKM Ac-2568]|nr:uncharacterized protein DUF4184 [Kribbella sp. VKM Ac-2568]
MASALVAGAVAPDLLYVGAAYRFATMYIDGNLTITRTHEFSAAFWLDPLLALLILLVFHLLVKRPLLALAPAALAGRLPSPAVRLRIPSLVDLFWIVVSTVIGAFTHVLWDSFTHYDGYLVRHNWKFFTADITPFWDLNRVLQYLSSVGGVLVIAIWLYFWWRKTPPSPVDSSRYVPAPARYAVLVAVVLLAAAAASCGGGPGRGSAARGSGRAAAADRGRLRCAPGTRRVCADLARAGPEEASAGAGGGVVTLRMGRCDRRVTRVTREVVGVAC